jgi:hypothetical protein
MAVRVIHDEETAREAIAELAEVSAALALPPAVAEAIRAEQREMVRPYFEPLPSSEQARAPIRPAGPILDGRMDSGGGVGEFGAKESPVESLLDPLFIGVNGLRLLTAEIHRRNVAAGWWSDPATGERKTRNVGEMLCLVHSEISEAMEGHRKNRMDDHLPRRPMIEVELADALVRIFDIAGGLGLDLAGAFAEKVAYNAHRPDHKIEARQKPGGKAY